MHKTNSDQLVVLHCYAGSATLTRTRMPSLKNKIPTNAICFKQTNKNPFLLTLKHLTDRCF